MKPGSAKAMRASLDARLNSTADAMGIDAGRLRRRLVFQRILRRIGPDDNWVLKGGYLLETRLSQGFRTTRDLDLASSLGGDPRVLSAELARVLADDPDGDYFVFRIGAAKPLTADSAGRAGWKMSVEALLDHRVFDRVRIDVMDRLQETVGGCESLRIPPPITGLEFDDAEVQSVDVAQHAAEKLHAMSRLYAGDRVSTRVKDLVDLTLMVDAGLLPDPRLAARLRTVFSARDGISPPPVLPAPPASWTTDFSTLSNATSAADTTLQRAFEVVSLIYTRAVDRIGKGPE